MKIAICDDSLQDRIKLENICKNSNITDNISCNQFSSGKELLDVLAKNITFDVVFLDVDMPGINGIETGKILRKTNKNIIIIFVTSYPEFALDAYECEAFHYLVKPCNPEKVRQVLQKAMYRLGLIYKYHIIKHRGTSIKIPISDIYYIECYHKHIIYHLKDQQIEVTDKLSNVYDSLSKFGFYQVHQGFIVNFEKVKEILKNTVILEDNRSVMLRVRKRSDVLLTYTMYLENLMK